MTSGLAFPQDVAVLDQRLVARQREPGLGIDGPETRLLVTSAR